MNFNLLIEFEVSFEVYSYNLKYVHFELYEYNIILKIILKCNIILFNIMLLEIKQELHGCLQLML